jgi:hypothetical protein
MVRDGNLHKFYEKIATKHDLGGGGKVRDKGGLSDVARHVINTQSEPSFLKPLS